jgi:ankyrin repeat protein
MTTELVDWRSKVQENLGQNLSPQEGENWEQLYQRLHEKIFSSKEGALHRAAVLGCERTVQRLILQEGHAVDELDVNGYSPLVHAVWENAPASVELLLRLEASLEEEFNCMTPLEYALSNVSRGEEGSAEIANLIIQRTPRIKATIMENIASQGNRIGLNLLLQRGFDINIQDEKGETALHHLVARARYDNHAIEKMKWFIGRGANVNIPNQYGETPLHHAMGMHAIECITLLLDHGADLFAVDKQRNGCISWGLFEGPPEAIIAREKRELAMRAALWGLKAAPYVLRCYMLYKRLRGQPL